MGLFGFVLFVVGLVLAPLLDNDRVIANWRDYLAIGLEVCGVTLMAAEAVRYIGA